MVMLVSDGSNLGEENLLRFLEYPVINYFQGYIHLRWFAGPFPQQYGSVSFVPSLVSLGLVGRKRGGNLTPSDMAL